MIYMRQTILNFCSQSENQMTYNPCQCLYFGCGCQRTDFSRAVLLTNKKAQLKLVL